MQLSENILDTVLELEDFFGIIFPSDTGIIYRLTVGGNLCLEINIRGSYIPLNPSLLPEENLLENFWSIEWTERDRQLIKNFLDKSQLGNKVVCPKQKFWDSGWGEGLVPVEIGSNKYFLVYQNSD